MKADKTFIGDSLDKVNWELMWRPAEFVSPCGPTGTCRQCESKAYSQIAIDFWDGCCYHCFKAWATPDQLKAKGLW